MREKLLALMQNEGLKSSQLAELLEINPAGISHILAGRNKPGFDLLQKILRRFPRINPDWLLLDSDIMYRDEVPAQPVNNQLGQPTHADNSNVEIETDKTNRPADDLFTTSQNLAESTTNNSNASAELNLLPGGSDRLRAGVKVRRIIVLYEDQTFESYLPTMR